MAFVVAAAVWLLMGPFLAMRAEGALRRDVFQGFGAPSFHLPGGSAFFGWFGVLLAVGGLACPGRLCVLREARSPVHLTQPRPLASLRSASLVSLEESPESIGSTASAVGGGASRGRLR